MISLALIFIETLIRPRRHDRSVRKRGRPDDLRLVGIRLLDSDPEVRTELVADAFDVSAQADDRTGHALPAQVIRKLVCNEAFGDSSQVDLALLRSHRDGISVDSDLLVIHVLHRIGQRFRRRRHLIRPVEVVQVARRPDGDVKRPVCHIAIRQSGLNDLDCNGVALHRCTSCVVDAVDVAALFGFAEQSLIPRALLKSPLDHVAGRLLRHPFHVVNRDLDRRIEVKAVLCHRLCLLRLFGAARLWYNECGREQKCRCQFDPFFHSQRSPCSRYSQKLTSSCFSA